MKHDIAVKRGKFIGKLNSLLQEFHFAEPEVFMKLLNFYCSTFYGSNLWNLYSAEVDKIFKSWNVTVRNVSNLPFTTHRYVIEPKSSCMHPKVMLASCYITFIDSLRSSHKLNVKFLVDLVKDDNRTLTGKTLSMKTNLVRSNLVAADIKKKIVV